MTEPPGPAPVHDIELEQALLGAILMNPAAFVLIEGLRPDHFYEPLHGLLFEGAMTLHQAGKLVSPLTLRTLLPQDFKFMDMTASQYMARCASAATSIINAKDYAASLRALSQIRTLQSILDNVSRFDRRHIFPDAALREAFLAVDTLRLDHPNQTSAITAAQSSAAFIDWMSNTMSGAIKQGGVTTGLLDLDHMTGGLKGGDLIIAAGRPGMGKTSFAEGLARSAARKGFGAGFFSLEMSEVQLQARLHCDEAFDEGGTPITYNQAINPAQFLTMEQGERLINAQERVAALPLMLDYSSKLTVGEIAAKSRGMAMTLKRKHNVELGLLVVDYLKFVQASERYRGQRVYEIAEITGGLKQLAKDLNVAVVLLCQLSRQVEMTEDKIPQLSHLRDSGDIEADADVVVFLYRRAYYLQNNPKVATNPVLQNELIDCMHRLMLVIAKNRHGPTGNIDVFCHMGASAIRNMAHEVVPEGML